VTRVWLVRHGETDWNRAGRFQGHTDIELNDAGRAQARAVVERLRGLGISRVTASDLRRARETAEILAAELPAALTAPEPELRERSYGAFEGLTREQCAERYPEIWNAHMRGHFVDVPGAEPRELVTERVVRGVTRVVSTHGEIAIVSHGGAIRAFLEGACGQRVPPVPNLAIYELQWVDGRFVRPRVR
jgi:probable phosphoglycerate mutase